jgi:2-dehydro-3-deoxygluconokinase
MKTVVTFGEAMIRLAPPGFQRLEQTDALAMSVGGAEWNVAVDLARLDVPSRWVSALPDNPLGRQIRNKAREHGVDTSLVKFVKEGRAGLYFVEYGSSPRASTVLYDRAGSAVSRLAPEDIDWGAAFAGAQWFHTTGITPALSESCAKATELAIKTARRMGLTVSYDLNYRGKLWSQQQARATTERFIRDVHVCVGNEEDASVVLGVRSGAADESYTKLDTARYADMAAEMSTTYGFTHVATSLRESPSVQRNRWSGMLYTGGKAWFSRQYDLEVVDRVGGGDAFSAGLIRSLLLGVEPQQAVEFAAAFSAIKHTIPTDMNWTTAAEVEALLKGGGARIKR